MAQVTLNVPADLHDFLLERVAQVNRHAAVLEGMTAQLSVDEAVLECIREWRSQVDPENILGGG